MSDQQHRPDRGPGRRGDRRRFGSMAVVVGLVLLAAGVVALGGADAVHDLGVFAIGLGIGVVVAGVFILAGWQPKGRG